MISITVNGRVCACEEGEYLLDVAERNGMLIPHLCYHRGLLPIGACRVCIVEVIERGRSKVVASCVYPVRDGIEVHTASPRIREQRSVIIALLLSLAPGSTEIKRLALQLGADIPRLVKAPESDTCVLCGRCTAACEALGTGAIAKVGRGVTKKIAAPFDGMPPDCIGCGSCAHVCPTGTIAYEHTDESVSVWGREFELMRCTGCNAPLMTREQHDFLTRKGGESPELLCERCGKQGVARKLKTRERYLG
ncbi:MAG: (2Fe-2S)-binding protein [Coriobacteriales bacterium]|jgi:NADH dehydrogenase/NADH:ubiquinone oxidoreductase subunit G|nr:(2Fe-2S)-binding protein [Coriobacteriales bacterium]